MPAKPTECPICESRLNHPELEAWHGNKFSFDCPRCGSYRLDRATFNDFAELKARPRYVAKVPYLPHAIRRLTGRDDLAPLFSLNDLEGLLANPPRPTPREQADNLIRLIGDAQSYAGEGIVHDYPETSGVVGTIHHLELEFILESLAKAGLIEFEKQLGPTYSTSLTFSGAERYEELRKGAASGTHAFMAMQFGNDSLDRIVDDCLRPAVTATGFELRRLNDPGQQKAGLIDDQLRVAIRAARFLIADLTHENNGAYWEAGYAEGLGKPVIYTCRSSIFKKRKGGTHFDTNHHLHILWEPDELDRVSAELKGCIRATVPEARQED